MGLFTSSIKAGLSASGIGKEESDSLTAPLPVIGLRGEYDFWPKWTVNGSAEIFDLEIDDVSGYLLDLTATIDYNIYKEISIGGGYNVVEIDISSTNNDFTGKYNSNYDGLLLYFKIGFGLVGTTSI